MTYVALPNTDTHRLSFYLAMEEFVARHTTIDEAFFMWQVTPSVIFGRNQLIDNEVNIDYCRQNDIQMYRRKSGGGCVYADLSNVMFSYITDDENITLTFNRYVNMVALTLCRMGIDAKATGRNDILIDGRKVSGNAFYHIPGRSIVHGTMLYDTDMRNMVAAITPSDEKLVSKGIQSVRQHIALLKDYTEMTLEEFKRFVKKNLCNEETTLSDEDIRQIETIEQEYLTDQFIYGRNPRYTIVRKGRIEGVGEIEVQLELKNNIIKGINMLGDYFITGDIDGAILKPLHNTPFDEEHLNKAIPDAIGNTVMNLKKEEFIKLLLNHGK